MTDHRSLPVGTELGDGLRVGFGGVVTAMPVRISATPNQKEGTMPAATADRPKSSPRKTRSTKPARKSAPKKSKLAKALEGTDEALAAFLLARPTYSDATWKDRAGGKSRRKGESREAFIRRVLLGRNGTVGS